MPSRKYLYCNTTNTMDHSSQEATTVSFNLETYENETNENEMKFSPTELSMASDDADFNGNDLCESDMVINALQEIGIDASELCESDMDTANNVRKVGNTAHNVSKFGNTGNVCKFGDFSSNESDDIYQHESAQTSCARRKSSDSCYSVDESSNCRNVLRDFGMKTTPIGLKRKVSSATFINPGWISCYIYGESDLGLKDRNGSDTPVKENLTQPLVGGMKKKGSQTQYLTMDTGHRNLGFRLEQRKKLMNRRRWLVDVEFSMAMIGILLMMVENELYYADREQQKDSTISFVLKLCISLTTIILLGAIVFYYQAGISLRMFDGRVDDPFAVTPISTWVMLVVELGICAIHPFPGNIQVKFLILQGGIDYGSVDGILSVLMMLRLYLVGKFIVVHSQLLTDSRAQSLAAVSHVKVNINFVLRAALNNHPTEVITIIILAEYAVSVWAMRTCELYYTDMAEGSSVSEAMWLSAITFLTVGYGDLTPRTHCGRFIAVSTAMMGLCSTALLVAVIARKLEQTRSEKYVHNFLVRVHLRNKFKGAAADVVKLAVKLFTLRRKRTIPVSALDRTVIRWRLNSAIRTMRHSRASQAELEEASRGMTEICQMISTMEMRLKETRETQREILNKMDNMQRHMVHALGAGPGSDVGQGSGGSVVKT